MTSLSSKFEMDLKQKINKAAKSIRKKYLALKLDRSEEDEALNRLLNPITDPLNELLLKTNGRSSQLPDDGFVKKDIKGNQADQVLKREPNLNSNVDNKKSVLAQTSSVYNKVRFQPTTIISQASADSEHMDDDDEVFEQSSPPIDESFKLIQERQISYLDFLEQYPQVARHYIDKFLQKSSDIDTTYGLDHDMLSNVWTMGNVKIDFLKNGDIKIGDVSYQGTPGLYNLLFLRKPTHYTQQDEDAYKNIIQYTNVHKRNYISTNQARGSKSDKYVNLIKPLLKPVISRTLSVSERANQLRKPQNITSKSSSVSSSSYRGDHSGSALLMEYNKKPKEYVYYDNINELVDRLVKLDASEEAGNGNHMNEILSILEELRELGVIQFDK